MNIASHNPTLNTSVWALASSWFTPSLLFCFLNLMIGTIFIISSTHKNKQSDSKHDDIHPPQLLRAPSLLQRVKSINYFASLSPFNFPAAQYDQTHPDQPAEEGILRSKSEPTTAAPTTRKIMNKSVSAKAVVDLAKEEKPEVVERRRPATVKESLGTRRELVDETVDEKADDFINRFRQQLKLQRLESILRYNEMLTRGAGK